MPVYRHIASQSHRLKKKGNKKMNVEILTTAETSLRRRVEAQIAQDALDSIYNDDSADEIDEEEAYRFLYQKPRRNNK